MCDWGEQGGLQFRVPLCIKSSKNWRVSAHFFDASTITGPLRSVDTCGGRAYAVVTTFPLDLGRVVDPNTGFCMVLGSCSVTVTGGDASTATGADNLGCGLSAASDTSTAGRLANPDDTVATGCGVKTGGADSLERTLLPCSASNNAHTAFIVSWLTTDKSASGFCGVTFQHLQTKNSTIPLPSTDLNFRPE
jgi:hypothetical protein